MSIAIVAGALANKCGNGGNAWTRLQWVLGLRKLGYRVYLLEQIDRQTCTDAAGAVTTFEDSANRAYFRHVTGEFGLTGSAALIYEGGEQTFGLPWADLLEVAAAADLLVNISGHLTLEPLKGRPRRRVYFDDDPGYTQIWHAAAAGAARLEGHDCYLTIGQNIGTPGCPIPTGGLRWHTTRPFVALDHWPASRAGDPDRFTTVASWRGPFGPVEFAGQTFGQKVHEFRKFIDLPRRAAQTFEIALGIHPAEEKDLALLRSHGWRLVDPGRMAPTPELYRRYLQTSGAEFSVAQGMYVQTQSGWFSDRTACYLASGKPALVQDTGFSRHYPVGDGLLAFRTVEEAAAGAAAIARDYDRHCAAARALAEAEFNSDVVLGRVLDVVGVAA